MISLHLLNTVFVSALITANVMAAKVVDVGFWHLFVPAAIPAFAVACLAGSVICELYGRAQMQRTIWMGFVAQAIAVGVFYFGMWLPTAPFSKDADAAYHLVLGGSWRIAVASLFAYTVMQYVDMWLFFWLGRLTKGKHKWLRNNGTIISYFVDTLIFVVAAFFGTFPNEAIVGMIIGQFLVKLCCSLIDTPVFYLLTKGHINEEWSNGDVKHGV